MADDRRRKRDLSPVDDDNKRRKLHSYTLEFKLNAISEVKKGKSKEATARKFGVAPKRIREWYKQEEKLKAMASHSSQSQRKRLDGGGRRPLLDTLEERVYEWIESMRSRRLRVTRKMVKREALKIFSNEGGQDYDSNPEFVASNGWLRNFFNRHRITLRQKTTVCQKLPDVLAPKVSSYLLYVRSKRLKLNLTLQNMGAMDETPIWLDMGADSTVDFVGNKSVPIKTTGHEKSRVTVVLAAKANGSKLPPFIVFKGKRVDKGLEKVTGVVCAYSKNGWMNENLTHTWLNKVWGSLAFSRRLLCWDAYRCHIRAAAAPPPPPPQAPPPQSKFAQTVSLHLCSGFQFSCLKICAHAIANHGRPGTSTFQKRFFFGRCQKQFSRCVVFGLALRFFGNDECWGLDICSFGS